MKELAEKYPTSKIKEIVSSFKPLKVLVVGDAIIDEYHFTTPKGRATKDPILSVDYISHEVYAGGILAIANHVSNFVDTVSCVTIVGDTDDRKDFMKKSLHKNVSLHTFVKKNAPTTIKKRYLNKPRTEKLFKVEHINDHPISAEIEKDILSCLEKELPKHDVVLVGDFGHGMITEPIIHLLEEKSKFLAVNAQCNSANLGFNFVTKYHKPTFLTMDIQELQYAVTDRFSDVPILMDKLQKKSGFSRFLVTLGKQGSRYCCDGKQTFFPAFVMRPTDTIGAGDAVFSISSLFAYSKNDDLIPFIANCVGGIAVSYMGNKEYVTQEDLFSFVEQVYKGEKQTS